MAGPEPPSFLLTRSHLWLQVPPGTGDVSQRVAWPERQLRWCGAAKSALAAVSDSPPPGELLSCSLQLLSQPAGDAAAVAELLGRLQREGVAATVVHTAPWPLPLRAATLDDLRVQTGIQDDPMTAVLPLLHRTGCAIFPAGADTSPGAVLPSLAALVTRRFVMVTEMLHSAQLRPFIDEFAYSDAASRSTGRMEVRLPLAASPACSDPDACALAQFASNAPWVRAVRAALRDPMPEVTASLIVSVSGATDQAWHADGPHLGALRPQEAWEALHAGDGRVGSPPHGLCVFLPLVDVTPQRGCTQMWLGSHAWGGLVEEAPRELGADAGGPLARWGAVLWPTVPAGTGVMYDYRLVHRGAANSEAERPVMQLVYRTAGATGSQGHRWWDESANFGEAPLMGALPPHADWSVQLQADDHGDAVRGAAWWASQAPGPTQQAPRERPAAPAGWALFD